MDTGQRDSAKPHRSNPFRMDADLAKAINLSISERFIIVTKEALILV